MKNIINLSLLNIKRDKSKIKIYIIIMTIFISLINILLNTSIILNESINSIYINLNCQFKSDKLLMNH